MTTRKLVAAGDSLTHDPYPGEYGNAGKGYMYSLPALFTTDGFQAIDTGVSGVTTSTFLATYWTAALAHGPRWMLIMFGTNDWDTLTPAQYKSNLARMFSECRAINCEPIMMTPPPFFYAAPPPTGYTTKIRRPYQIGPFGENAIAQAITDGVAYIDLYTTIADFYDTTTFATAYATYGVGGGDVTHWIAAGALKAAQIITAALPAVCPSLASYLLPVAEPAWTTLAQLKSFAGITGATYDADLTDIIDAVTARMKSYIVRSIGAKRYTAERHSMSQPWQTLILDERPVSSVVEVRADGDALHYDDYVVLGDRGSLFLDGGWPMGTNHLEVDYVAGYATVPSDLQNACATQARYEWTLHNKGGNRFGQAQRSEASGGSSAFIVQDWYPGVETVLRSYRRLV